MSILRVESLSKSYKKYSSEFRRVASWFGLPIKPISENYVLKDVNFSIGKGEAIGIIGQNGAGKSTLLKIITGTLPPTSGKVEVDGKVAAILELGMGFNGEFSGRQNAYHGLSMMGYSQKDIENIMPTLEAFAEIGDYFDKPVRTYSSGMQMRVAFAVATAFRPDILIIDEALSVGDAYFQHKSFDKIKQFGNQGTTLLFVSHDKSSILALCKRAILIEKGKILKDGKPEEITDYYNALLAEKENATIRQEKMESGRVQTISGTSEATIEKVTLLNKDGKQIEVVNVAEDVSLKVLVKVNKNIPNLVLGYAIKDRLGQVVFGTNTYLTKQIISAPKVGLCYEFDIGFQATFGVGSYSVTVALHDNDNHINSNYEWRDMAAIFTVANIDKTHFAGLLWQEPDIRIKEKS